MSLTMEQEPVLLCAGGEVDIEIREHYVQEA